MDEAARRIDEKKVKGITLAVDLIVWRNREEEVITKTVSREDAYFRAGRNKKGRTFLDTLVIYCKRVEDLKKNNK